MLDGGTLLIILTALQASSAQNLGVYQILKVSATEHGSVTLFCNFTFNGTFTGYNKWYRHEVKELEVTNTSKGYIGRVSFVSPTDFMYQKSANLQLHQLNLSDSGLYICEVTLMTSPLWTARGNGTYLDVKSFVAEDSKLQLAIAASCSTITIIAILVFAAVAVFLGYHKKFSECLVLRNMEDEDVHTYCTAEEIRSHIYEQTIPQKL
ncbi:natural cytotoxicity triggering receptor 3-like isoform X2 [Aquarana catesbeiana]|uniref:natural cytotoxicity triggering receptor 3-like isoform X2 n=1 Tax=Aquarana catesbeiana TaxID=8400 RepID=UPI003CC9D973